MKSNQRFSFSAIAATAVITSLCSFSSAWATPILSGANTGNSTQPQAQTAKNEFKTVLSGLPVNLSDMLKRILSGHKPQVTPTPVAVKSVAAKPVVTVPAVTIPAVAIPAATIPKPAAQTSGNWNFQTDNASIAHSEPTVGSTKPATDTSIIDVAIIDKTTAPSTADLNKHIDVVTTVVGADELPFTSPTPAGTNHNVPEPTSLILLMLGFTGLFVARKRAI